MIPATSSAEPLFSTLSADSDLGPLVELFVEEIPNRVANLLDRLQASDWDGVRRAAHQLKGAAGSYGFAPISPVAGRLENAVRHSHPEEEILRAADELIDLCRRARVGTIVTAATTRETV